MYKVCVSSHTDIGDKKKTNQDSVFAANEIINKHNVCMFIVADGCGGLQYGDEISKLIVSYFSRFWNNELMNLLSSKKFNIDVLDLCLNNALDHVNHKALMFSEKVGSRVGSTLTMFVSVDSDYIVKNVGDSRAYLKRKNKIIQLTEDQSLVADMIRNGELTLEEAKNYKRKNVLTMCIGAFAELKVYSHRGKIKDRDIFVLCSDGLHNHVPAEKMLETLRSSSHAFEKKAQLLRECIEHGGANDNVSSVVCGYYKMHYLLPSSILILAVIAVILSLIFKDVLHDLLFPIIKYIK